MIIKTVTNFQSLASAIELVYLVEASPALREAQKQLLCEDVPFADVPNGVQCKSKYGDLMITWYEDIRFVPNGCTLDPNAAVDY